MTLKYISSIELGTVCIYYYSILWVATDIVCKPGLLILVDLGCFDNGRKQSQNTDMEINWRKKINGQKRTETDRKEREMTETDRNRQKMTETDRNRQNLTKTYIKEQ